METEEFKNSYLLNYILNDGAFDNLLIKCLYGEPLKDYKQELQNQIDLLRKELQNSIPKKKIEDKKEENSKLFFETKDIRYANRFKVVQELLEDK